MPLVPLVAIDIPAEVAPELATEALRSCNLALGRGQCVRGFDSPLASTPTWIARLRRDPLRERWLQIELSEASNQAKTVTHSRQLDFEPSDAAARRWSTAGVVVAALVISAESSRRGSSANSSSDARVSDDANGRAGVTTPPPNQSTDTQSRWAWAHRNRGAEQPPQAARSNAALRIDLAAMGGQAISGHDLRLGLNLRSSVTLTRPLMLWGALSGSRVRDAVSIFWWSGAAGVGLVTGIVPEWVSVEIRLAATVERLICEAKNVAGETDSAARWRYGTGLGLDAVLDLSQSLGVFLGIDGSFKQPQVNIRSAGLDVGQLPTTEILFGGGFRWRMPLGHK